MTLRRLVLSIALALGSPAWAADRLVLLDPGQEPREELRYGPVLPKKETMRMEMTMAMGMGMAGMDLPPTRIPPMIMDMDLSDVRVGPAGEVSYRFVLKAVSLGQLPDATPGLAEAMKPALDSLVGTAGSVTISATGQVLDSTLEPVAGADPNTVANMNQAMGNASAQLPVEPVGAGARWEQHTTVENNGLKVEQVTLYELVSLDKKTAKLKVSVTQSAPAQDFAPPGMPAGATARLESMQSTGSGTTSLPRKGLVPTAEMQVTSDFSMGFSMEGQSMPMTMSLDMATSISPL